ncbi:MAG: NADH-quinone oxidoreductase subunit M [Acidobacteriaceae bacterium]|nr:NADH-quinone oxidoreductase subunit M [Acidobacteriaceae bacterium]MBV9500411.1 NADH-quinone oxidoreductase subunit M [Acidobacteriaceae bacterium]
MNPLGAVLLIPLIGFFILLFLPRESKASFAVALIATLAAFFTSLTLIAPANAASGHFSSTVDRLWVDTPGLRIHLHLGVDGINLWLVILTTLLLPIAVWISQTMIKERHKNFYALLLLFEFGLIGVFSALDLFIFYVFWEVALVPMYLMVGSWGSARRGPAAVKFFVYTMLGSVLMLASIIYLYTEAGSFDYVDIMNAVNSGRVMFSPTQQMLLFLGFFAAFAVKVPIFPLHTWLPDTYTEAPVPATFLLAAVMSKMGAYGLLRYCLPLVPTGAHRCSDWIAALAITGIVYGALIALIQRNLKRLIAYSSISHLGFVVLGIFTFSQQGADGAVYQMIAHGISTGALFLLVGYLEERRGSLDIADFGGIATPAPALATVFLIALFASVGLPTLCNFIGEYLILQGAALTQFSWAAWAAIGVVLSAAYMLWMYQRTFLGKTEAATGFLDLTRRDWVPVLPLIALMIWLGSYTQSFMPPISSATSRLLEETTVNNQYRVQLTMPSAVPAAEVVDAH